MAVDVRELGRRIALEQGEDPALILAAGQMESGWNPYARGDRLADPRAVGGYCSFGVFQENVCGGAGTGKELGVLFDPVGSTRRFIDRIRRVRSSGFVGTPGQIAAAAQRPFDPIGYAAKVDALYVGYGGQDVASPPPARAPDPVMALPVPDPREIAGDVGRAARGAAAAVLEAPARAVQDRIATAAIVALLLILAVVVILEAFR